MNYRVLKLFKRLPEPVRHVLIGLLDKRRAEMLFQRGWAAEFRTNQSKVLEYWRKFRHLDEIRDYLKLTDQSRVLDVGCGISSVLHFLPGKRVGLDPNAEEYVRIYDYPVGIEVRAGDGESLSFDDASFDAVFCTNVIDHVSDPGQVLDQIARVLSPGGHLVLTVETFTAQMTRDPAHPHAMTQDDIVALVSKRFEIRRQWTAPWIGLRNYVADSRPDEDNNEVILVCEKVATPSPIVS